jgi:hypothetical protein
MFIAFNNHGYIIDAALLHDHLYSLKTVLENGNIVKYCCKQNLLLNDLKRDFNIFAYNLFDLEYI